MFWADWARLVIMTKLAKHRMHKLLKIQKAGALSGDSGAARATNPGTSMIKDLAAFAVLCTCRLCSRTELPAKETQQNLQVWQDFLLCHLLCVFEPQHVGKQIRYCPQLGCLEANGLWLLLFRFRRSFEEGHSISSYQATGIISTKSHTPSHLPAKQVCSRVH